MTAELAAARSHVTAETESSAEGASENQIQMERAELTALQARQILLETSRQNDTIRIEELEKAVAKGNEDLLLSSTRVQSLLQEMESIKSLQAEEAVPDKQILSLQSSLTQANDEIERLKKLLADMTSAKNAGDARISTLEGQGKADRDEITSLNKRLSELESVLQKTGEEMTVMTVKYTDMMSSSAAAKDAADKEIVDLKSQLTALQTSSSQTIADFQTRLKTMNDEANAYTKKIDDLTTAKAMVDQHIEALQVQNKKASDDLIASSRATIAGNRPLHIITIYLPTAPLTYSLSLSHTHDRTPRLTPSLSSHATSLLSRPHRKRRRDCCVDSQE